MLSHRKSAVVVDGKRRATKIYSTWTSIKTRCLNKASHSYARYGGKGVTICARWLCFENFLADMGEPPGREYTIDRIDNVKGYEPGNCRWLPGHLQSRNKGDNRWITAHGRKMLMEDWAKETGINKTTIFMRITKYGWSEERAVTQPARKWGNSL